MKARPLFCGQCGTEVRGARYCGQCGAQIEGTFDWPRKSRSPDSEPAGFSDNQAGAIAYCTPVVALAMLLFEPYRRNRFVRFHSYQCLFLTLAYFAGTLAAGAFWLIGFPSPHLFLAGWQLIVLGMWALAAFRAWRGSEFRLPVVGGFAVRHAFGRVASRGSARGSPQGSGRGITSPGS